MHSINTFTSYILLC